MEEGQSCVVCGVTSKNLHAAVFKQHEQQYGDMDCYVVTHYLLAVLLNYSATSTCHAAFFCNMPCFPSHLLPDITYGFLVNPRTWET
jgi:hypothetical protein